MGPVEKAKTANKEVLICGTLTQRDRYDHITGMCVKSGHEGLEFFDIININDNIYFNVIAAFLLMLLNSNNDLDKYIDVTFFYSYCSIFLLYVIP